MKKNIVFTAMIILCTVAILMIAYKYRPTGNLPKATVTAVPTKSVMVKTQATDKSDTVIVTGKINATFDTEQKFSAPK